MVAEVLKTLSLFAEAKKISLRESEESVGTTFYIRLPFDPSR